MKIIILCCIGCFAADRFSNKLSLSTSLLPWARWEQVAPDDVKGWQKTQETPFTAKIQNVIV